MPGYKPAARLALYALGANFVWEMLQAPLFVGMLEMPRWDAAALCLRATVGDAVMILLAYAGAALSARDRAWMQRPSAWHLSAYAFLAALQGLALEWVSLRQMRWSYAPSMPIDPVTGLGLTPILQWLVLPLAILWAVRHGETLIANKPVNGQRP